MEALKVRIDKLITQTEYAKLKGVSQPAVFKMMKNNKVTTVKIQGATLILLP